MTLDHFSVTVVSIVRQDVAAGRHETELTTPPGVTVALAEPRHTAEGPYALSLRVQHGRNAEMCMILPRTWAAK